nr:hypothetical protein CFP56_17358 [Quercus suber]
MAAETLPLSNGAVANGDHPSNPNLVPKQGRRCHISQVEVKYVPEPAELDDGMDEEFRKIFSQLSFRETTATQTQIAKLKQICSRPDVEGKCGIEKQPFQQPDFFAATGIEKIRQVFRVSAISFLSFPMVYTNGFFLDSDFV